MRRAPAARRPRLTIEAPLEPNASFELSESGTFEQEGIVIDSKGTRIRPSSREGSAGRPPTHHAVVPAPTVSASRECSRDHEDDQERSFDLGPEDIIHVDLVGKGASSVVKRAYNKRTKSLVALKVMNVLEDSKRKQMMKEIRALSESASPYLVSFLGAYYDEGTISLALEYMDAGSLADALKRKGKIEEHLLAQITRQALLGLAYLHKERHVVHRDIKPSNLLLSGDGTVKITDFGISSELENSAQLCNTFVGTMGYMSPERIRGERYSYSADIWALGVTLIECATGRYPYKARGFWDVMNRILQDDAPTLSAALHSQELVDFVTQCLQKDPDSRASVLELLAHPFLQRSTAEENDGELRQWMFEIRSQATWKWHVRGLQELGYELVTILCSFLQNAAPISFDVIASDACVTVNGVTCLCAGEGCSPCKGRGPERHARQALRHVTALTVRQVDVQPSAGEELLISAQLLYQSHMSTATVQLVALYGPARVGAALLAHRLILRS